MGSNSIIKKKLVFLTGTRADFGKLKSLITITQSSINFETHIFATGMHLQKIYGKTVEEIEKSGFNNIHKYKNFTNEASMDQTLAKTIKGFSSYVLKLKPDLIIIHGDRLEALAGAVVGAFNNILVAHIEGGEVSGTIDELIRHAVSKLSHTHFVSNKLAKKRLTQMGEIKNNIFLIGSPDVDVMMSKNLPSLEEVKKRYDIGFNSFCIVLFHPVTTEINETARYAKQFIDALLKVSENFIVIYPNNDLGSSSILKEYMRLDNLQNFKIFPSLRFEYFLVLLKNANLIIGNSSAGIREAPYFGLPTINVGTRQQNRASSEEIINCSYDTSEIIKSIRKAKKINLTEVDNYGEGKSDELFLKVLNKPEFWEISKQKIFKDI